MPEEARFVIGLHKNAGIPLGARSYRVDGHTYVNSPSRPADARRPSTPSGFTTR